MSGLCGWFDKECTGAAGPESIAVMAAAINRFDSNPIQSACAAFGRVAVAARPGEVHVFQDHDQLVAIWGDAHFHDVELTQLAQRTGMGHALAHGYASIREDVFKLLSGSFAVAVLNG